MIRRTQGILICLSFILLFCHNLYSQTREFINGDLLPDAPELAVRGEYSVGVRTIDLVDKDRLDILNRKDGNVPKYDRSLKVEVWYPAHLEGKKEIEFYDEVMGVNGDTLRPLIPFQFKGRCLRDAKPFKDNGKFPLLIMSHGYPGSRLIFTYLAENLASKGYVVASIDHLESTYRDRAAFESTILNRSLDQLFVLNEMDRLGQDKSNFLAGIVDVENTGLLGYSMGGFGAVNTVGGGYSKMATTWFQNNTGSNALAELRGTDSEVYKKSIDPRIKVMVAFAPWGKQLGVWDSTGLAGIEIPSLFVSGSQDDISMYVNGVKSIFERAVNSDRYLLTYLNARHNVAGNPPPVEALEAGLDINEYLRYGDSVWDVRRINNINQHFITAFLGAYLKDSKYLEFLQLEEESNAAKVWKGFKPRTSVGLKFKYLKAN